MAKRKKTIRCIVVLGAFLTFAACLVVPALMRARLGSMAGVCLSNVRGLGQACKMYAIHHGGRFPDNLAQLYPDYVNDLKYFFCPADRGSCPPRNVKAFDEASASYAIVPGLSGSDDPDTVLIYEKSIWNHGGKSVFFIDGHAETIFVDRMAEKDFDEIAKGLRSFFTDRGRYPTNEEGLEMLVSSGCLRFLPVDPFDPNGKRSYGYATKNVNNNWILTCYGPDSDADVDLSLYSKGKLSTEDLLRLETKLTVLGMSIKRSDGDIFRVGP